MKLLVVGAAGQTGRAVVEQAVKAGHEVTAFVRSDRPYAIPGVAVWVGDATDAEAMEGAVRGHDAVINTVAGRTPYRHTELETNVATTIIGAMQHHRVERLLVTSSLGVGDSIANTPFFVRILVATFLRGSTADKANMEAAVRVSGLDWTITRPAVLSNKPPTGNVHVLSTESREKAQSITRADLAGFLVAQLTSDDHLRQTLTLANR